MMLENKYTHKRGCYEDKSLRFIYPLLANLGETTASMHNLHQIELRTAWGSWLSALPVTAIHPRPKWGRCGKGRIMHVKEFGITSHFDRNIIPLCILNPKKSNYQKICLNVCSAMCTPGIVLLYFQLPAQALSGTLNTWNVGKGLDSVQNHVKKFSRNWKEAKGAETSVAI